MVQQRQYNTIGLQYVKDINTDTVW